MIEFFGNKILIDASTQSSSPTYGTIFGIKTGPRTMACYAFLGSEPVITPASGLRWKTVEVAFTSGTIERVAAEHGLTPQVRGSDTIGVGDLAAF